MYCDATKGIWVLPTRGHYRLYSQIWPELWVIAITLVVAHYLIMGSLRGIASRPREWEYLSLGKLGYTQ
uniref:Uncharacterized protein n=1 Tax=Anguilla anguilla TaxID=7936 RepID=A0A0E9S1X6_ANGAN